MNDSGRPDRFEAELNGHLLTDWDAVGCWLLLIGLPFALGWGLGIAAAHFHWLGIS